MGYDFLLMRMNDRERKSFPLPCDAVSEEEYKGAIPWKGFREWLLQNGGEENGGKDSIYVDFGESGRINFNGDSKSIYLDTHSEWENVLMAYEAMIALDPNCCIFDMQTGEYHDEGSFREFMRQA